MRCNGPTDNTVFSAQLRFGVCALMLVTPATWADISTPLEHANRSPFHQLFGLPEARAGRITGPGESEWWMAAEVASNFLRSAQGDEAIALDGEQHRYWVRGSYGFAPDWSLQLTVPYLRHSGGHFDKMIDRWHRTFGLSEGGRDSVARDQLQYRVTRDGDEVLYFDQSTSGLGDVRIDLSYQWLDQSLWDVSLHLGVKLPTGDEDKLLGSGATDVSASIAASYVAGDFAWHISGGALYMDDGQVLEEQQNNLAVFGSTGIAWQVLERLSLKLQLDAHSALFDSKLTPLGESVQLVMGGDLRLSDRWTMDIAVAEDILVEASPDVVFQIGLRAAY